jgi:hypothetical protein
MNPTKFSPNSQELEAMKARQAARKAARREAHRRTHGKKIQIKT